MIKKTNKMTLEQRIAKLEKALLEEMSDGIQGEVTLVLINGELPAPEIGTFDLSSVTPKMIANTIKSDLKKSPEEILTAEDIQKITEKAEYWADRDYENALRYHDIDKGEMLHTTYTHKQPVIAYSLASGNVSGMITPNVNVVVESDIRVVESRVGLDRTKVYFKVTDIFFENAGDAEWDASSRSFKAIKDTELGMKLTELGEGVASLL